MGLGSADKRKPPDGYAKMGGWIYQRFSKKPPKQAVFPLGGFL